MLTAQPLFVLVLGITDSVFDLQTNAEPIEELTEVEPRQPSCLHEKKGRGKDERGG